MALIRVALAGAGLSGQVFHAPFILGHPDLFDLQTVIELNPPSPRGTIGDKFGITTKLSEHLDDALNDPDIDLVIIATPSHLHFGMAKVSLTAMLDRIDLESQEQAALNANKHVVIDKPVTTTLAEATELGELAESRNLILTGFQNRRWDSDFMALRKLLADGLLGKLVDFESQYVHPLMFKNQSHLDGT
jgi:predicted dehydrogenase